MKQEIILDALAWAGISEKARIARIANKLALSLHSQKQQHSKTKVKEAVKNTAPPYGRGKIITNAVEIEYRRQLPISLERRNQKGEELRYENHMAMKATRINNAYAAAFNRPIYQPRQYWERSKANVNDSWEEIDAKNREFNIAEERRDKGDECIALKFQGNYTIALLRSSNHNYNLHIAVRSKQGIITRTYLRANKYEIKNFVEVITSLGGSKVKAALARGNKVITDWSGRRSFIHHDNINNRGPRIEELPWRSIDHKTQEPIIIHGEIVINDTNPIPSRGWNDVD
jgi:hypothetical protein